MDDNTRKLLQGFSNSANKTTLHALDWSRYYDVIIALHAQGANVPKHEVKNNLWASTFSEATADRLSVVLGHGMELLKRYDEARRNP